EESISIRYSTQQCDSEWNVPPDTVLQVTVFPKVRPELEALKLDLTKLKKVHGDYDVLDHFYYIDNEHGLRLSVRSGMVEQYIYEPTAADEYLRCATDRIRHPTENDCLPLGFSIECSSEVL